MSKIKLSVVIYACCLNKTTKTINKISNEQPSSHFFLTDPLFELKIIFMTRLCHPLFDSVSIRNVFRCVDTLFDQRPLRRQKNTISFLLEIDACQCFISLSARSLLMNYQEKETFTHGIEMLYQLSNTLPILICTTLINRLLN